MNASRAVVDRPAPLGRAFDRIRATRTVDAEAAEHALMEVLRPVIDSVWPEVAWRSGVLTATGYPVELAWASRDVALRWTCEVAGPEVPEADRLGLAQRAAAGVAGSCVDVGPWASVQRGHQMRWGAWLGLRQLDGVRRAKVYLELPAGRIAPGRWSEAGAQLTSRVAGLAWRMAGINDDGSVELYARVPDLTWAALTAAAALVGDEGQLVDLVCELVGRPSPPTKAAGAARRPDGRRRGVAVLPRPSGLGLVLAPSGTPLALTWFAIAKTVWPGDAAVRAAVLRTTEAVDHPAASRELYEALSSGPDDGRWRHGMVGVGVDRGGGAWLQAGLQPT